MPAGATRRSHKDQLRGVHKQVRALANAVQAILQAITTFALGLRSRAASSRAYKRPLTRPSFCLFRFVTPPRKPVPRQRPSLRRGLPCTAPRALPWAR